MSNLHIDFETRSAADLKAVGTDVYSKHPTTDVWCMAYAFDDEPVGLIACDPRADGHLDPGQSDDTDRVHAHIKAGGIVVGQNVAFELYLWNNVMVPRYGWPPLKPEQCRCTMAMLYAMALPGSLEKGAAAVGIAQQKDMKGSRLMLQMAKPRRVEKCPDCGGAGCTYCDGEGTHYVWWDDEDRKQRLYGYCKTDVEVERELDKRLCALSTTEQNLWLLDRTINQRGVHIDQSAIRGAIEVVAKEKLRLNAEMKRLTGNAVGACTNVNQLTDWLRWQGVETGGVAKADIVALLDDESLPGVAREALLLRQEAAKSSTAKLTTMLNAVSADGRVRETKQYHGAGTGRWAGRRMQTDNFPRPTLKQPHIEYAVKLLEATDVDAIETLFGRPTQVVSDCLRAMITAAPGHDLIAGDFSAIEARTLPWLAGDELALKEFRDYDTGVGPEPYCVMASDIFRKPIDKKRDPNERQIGKVTILQLGYEGGIGAWVSAGRNYGIDLEALPAAVLPTATEEELHKAEKAAERFHRHSKSVSLDAAKACDIPKQRFRGKYLGIVDYWAALKNAAISAVLNAGQIYSAGAKGREVRFRMNGSFLWCQLPSKRVLCYPYPKLVEGKFGGEALQYKSVHSMTRKWVDVDTYGGKLAENVTQAAARDLLAEALVRLEAAGYPVVMHVHDEAVCEVPEGFGSVEQMESIMSEVPEWAKGLPIATEGWRGKRFRK